MISVEERAKEMLDAYAKKCFADMNPKKYRLQTWEAMKEYWLNVNPMVKRVAIIQHLESFALFVAKQERAETIYKCSGGCGKDTRTAIEHDEKTDSTIGKDIFLVHCIACYKNEINKAVVVERKQYLEFLKQEQELLWHWSHDLLKAIQNDEDAYYGISSRHQVIKRKIDELKSEFEVKKE